MHNIYKVGGHCFKVSGSILCSVLERMAGFAPFEVAEEDDNVPEFFFMEGKSGNIPAFCERQYVFAHEGTRLEWSLKVPTRPETWVPRWPCPIRTEICFTVPNCSP